MEGAQDEHSAETEKDSSEKENSKKES